MSNNKNPNEKQPGEKAPGTFHYNPGNMSGKKGKTDEAESEDKNDGDKPNPEEMSEDGL